MSSRGEMDLFRSERHAHADLGASRHSVLDDARTENVVVHFSRDRHTEVLRAFIAGTMHSCGELWSIVRRLGLPPTSVLTKAPYAKEAFREPERFVCMDEDVRAVSHARSSGALWRKPHHTKPLEKYLRGPPGVLAVVAANLALFWVLYNVKV